MNKKNLSVFDFRLWLNKKFAEGKVNNISLTEHWIDLFVKENAKENQDG